MEKRQIDLAVSSIAALIEASTDRDEPIDDSRITEGINQVKSLFENWNNDDEELIKFRLESYFTVKLSEKSITLANPDVDYASYYMGHIVLDHPKFYVRTKKGTPKKAIKNTGGDYHSGSSVPNVEMTTRVARCRVWR